ncbi:MAG: polysaccharide deacetylase, partial [Clostridia bacterium]|nr:polysaccharide deacetylase [Clostridia bacterium]
MHAQTSRMGSGRKNGESDADYAAAFTLDAMQCQEKLLAATHIEPLAYVYPYGIIDPASPRLLKEMGFRVTLSCYEERSRITRGDPDCLFSLGRYNRPSGPDTESFFAGILGES